MADDYQRSIKGWTVTTNGSAAGPGGQPYFIRLSKTGDPNAAISYNVGNGGPTLDQRNVIDAGFLELTRLGILAAADADVQRSLPVVDAAIKSDTGSGPGWHRYNGDGYGDRSSDGRPWAPSGQGTGHVWPVLSAERAEQALQTGNGSSAVVLLDGMAKFASGVGLIPEQDWEFPDLAASPYGTDPTVASIGFVNGKPAGSAAPLTWSAGAFVRLFADIAAGHLVDQPANTVARYVTHTQGQTTLTVTSPADNSAVTGSVTVAGTSVPGNRIDVLATNVDGDFTTAATSGTAAAGSGSFSFTVPVTPGTTVLNIVATSKSGATAHAARTVVYDFVPGTQLLDVADPDNDDNGPGNYAYPTSDNFKPGAFDLQRFQIYDDGTNITFRVQIRDLAPTFGSPLGAQLVDVYVRDPGAAHDVHGGVVPAAELHHRRGLGVEPADRGAGLRPALHRRQRRDPRYRQHPGQPGVALHHLQRPEGQPRPAGQRLGRSRWCSRARTASAPTRPEASSRPRRTSSSASAPRRAATRTAPFDPGSVPKAVDVITPSGVVAVDRARLHARPGGHQRRDHPLRLISPSVGDRIADVRSEVRWPALDERRHTLGGVGLVSARPG